MSTTDVTKKISRVDTAFASNVYIPTQTYRVCCTKSELGKSRVKAKTGRGGNPMITLTVEIVEPETVANPNNPDKPQRITGVTFSLYLTLVATLVGKQRESSMAQVWKFMDKTGVTSLCTLDPDSGEPDFEFDRHEEYFKGLEWDMPLSSTEKFKRAKPTDEQFAAGEPGDFLVDGEGNKIPDGYQIEARLEDVPPNCRPSRRENVAF